MIRIFSLINLLTFLFMYGLQAQTIYFTRTGKIEFHSGTSLEDIDATNNEVSAVMDIQKSTVAFQVLIKSFHFRRAMMEEHFNENYMESSRFPKATFTGSITNADKINFTEEGSYPATIDGVINIHGVSRKISSNGTFIVKGGRITGSCTLILMPEDYNIKIPGIVADKISKEVKVNIQCIYEPRN